MCALWGLTGCPRGAALALPTLIARWRRRENSLRIYPCCSHRVRFGVWPGVGKKNPPGREPAGGVKVPVGDRGITDLQREDSNFRWPRYWLWRATFPSCLGSKTSLPDQPSAPQPRCGKRKPPGLLGAVLRDSVGNLGSAGAPREGLQL